MNVAKEVAETGVTGESETPGRGAARDNVTAGSAATVTVIEKTGTSDARAGADEAEEVGATIIVSAATVTTTAAHVGLIAEIEAIEAIATGTEASALIGQKAAVTGIGTGTGIGTETGTGNETTVTATIAMRAVESVATAVIGADVTVTTEDAAAVTIRALARRVGATRRPNGLPEKSDCAKSTKVVPTTCRSTTLQIPNSKG